MASLETVKAQQVALNKKGANLKVDGILGPKTQAAIKQYSTGFKGFGGGSSGGKGTSSSFASKVNGVNLSANALQATLLPGVKNQVLNSSVSQPSYTVPGSSKTYTKAGLANIGLTPTSPNVKGGVQVFEVSNNTPPTTESGYNIIGGNSNSSNKSNISSNGKSNISSNGMALQNNSSPTSFVSAQSSGGGTLGATGSSVGTLGGSAASSNLTNSNVGNGLNAGSTNTNQFQTPGTPVMPNADPYAQDPNTANAQKEVDKITAEEEKNRRLYMSLLGQEANKTNDTLNAESAAGLPGMNADLLDLQAKAQMQTAQYMNTQNMIENKPIANEFIAGQQNEVQRQYGINAMITNSLISAKSGQIQTAQAQVDRAMEIKYAPIEARIAMQKQIIDWNYQDLSRADKKLADARSVVLDKQKEATATQKAIETQVRNIQISAAQFGAPTSVINSLGKIDMTKPDAITQALTIAKGFLTDPQEKQIKNAQIQAIKDKNTATNDDLQQIADSIMRGEQPPTLTGLYSKSAGVRAALAKKGYNLVKAQADWDALKKFTASNNSPQQLRMKQAESSVENSLGNLETLNNDYNRSGFKFVNKADLVAATNGIYGTVAAQKAQALLGQVALITDELGQTFMGGNSPTDAAFDLAKQVFSGNFTRDVLNNQIQELRKNLQYRKNSWATVQATGLGGANQYTTQDPLGLGITSTNNDPLGLGI